MNRISFTVLIPVYNVEKYLKQCLDSVLNQTYKNFEIILINDGSTDNSGKICDIYAQNDIRIKVYHQKNKGLARARYEGMKYSKGLFTLFLDSDDYWEKNLLEDIYKIIENKDIDLVIFNYKKVSEKGEIISKNISSLKNDMIYTTKNKLEIYEQMFFTDKLNSIWRKAIKTSLIKLEDYFDYLDIENGEDNMFSLPLLIRAEKILNIGDKFYNYRYNPKSITNIFKESKIKDEYMREQYSLLYLEKLNLASKNNIKKLNNFFIQKMLIHILILGYSDKEKSEKMKILKKMKKNYLSRKDIELFEIKDIKLRLKIICILYKFNKNNLIFIYISLLKYLGVLKRKIKK